MSVTITFLTHSSYTSQPIAVVTTPPVYLTHQNLIGYISAISKPFTSGFHQSYLLFKGYKDSYNSKCPTLPVHCRNSNINPLGEEDI